MSTNAAALANPTQSRSSAAFGSVSSSVGYFLAGLAILIGLWWLAIYIATKNPALAQFANFGPVPAFKAIPHMWNNGLIPKALQTSGYRLGMGLLIAIARSACRSASSWGATRYSAT